MKRVVLSVVGTVAGLVALLSFKSQSHPLTTTGALPSAGLPSTPTPTSTPNTLPVGGSASSGAGQSAGGGTRSTSAASSQRTVMGNAVETQYGIVQVQVTLTGHHIDNVSFVQLQAFDRRSQEINSQAAPILLQETLSTQNSHIDAVSGATYTSDGYVESLQSALDQVGVR